MSDHLLEEVDTCTTHNTGELPWANAVFDMAEENFM